MKKMLNGLMKRKQMMKKLASVLSMSVMVCFISMIMGISYVYAENEIRFGILTALSGPASVWGIANGRAIEMGADEINEKGGFKVKGETYKWKVLMYDSQMYPAGGVKALNKAIYSDKVSFVAIQGGAVVMACMNLLKQNNILSLNNASAGKAITNPDNPLVFRFNPSPETAYSASLPYIQKHEGIKTVACINPDNESGRAFLASAQFIMDKINLTIVASEFHEQGIKDFTPLITRMIAKNPDMIETGTMDPTSQALVLKQARELGYKGTIFLTWGPDPKQVLKIARQLAEGAYLGTSLAEPANEKQKAIKARFLKGYPERDWNANYYTHYALVDCLTKGIVKSQSFDPMTIAKALENLTWEDAYGPVSFGGSKLFGIKRQMLQQSNLLKVINGEVTWIISAPTPPGILD